MYVGRTLSSSSCRHGTGGARRCKWAAGWAWHSAHAEHATHAAPAEQTTVSTCGIASRRSHCSRARVCACTRKCVRVHTHTLGWVSNRATRQQAPSQTTTGASLVPRHGGGLQTRGTPCICRKHSMPSALLLSWSSQDFPASVCTVSSFLGELSCRVSFKNAVAIAATHKGDSWAFGTGARSPERHMYFGTCAGSMHRDSFSADA